MSFDTDRIHLIAGLHIFRSITFFLPRLCDRLVTGTAPLGVQALLGQHRHEYSVRSLVESSAPSACVALSVAYSRRQCFVRCWSLAWLRGISLRGARQVAGSCAACDIVRSRSPLRLQALRAIGAPSLAPAFLRLATCRPETPTSIRTSSRVAAGTRAPFLPIRSLPLPPVTFAVVVSR